MPRVMSGDLLHVEMTLLYLVSVTKIGNHFCYNLCSTIFRIASYKALFELLFIIVFPGETKTHNFSSGTYNMPYRNMYQSTSQSQQHQQSTSSGNRYNGGRAHRGRSPNTNYPNRLRTFPQHGPRYTSPPTAVRSPYNGLSPNTNYPNRPQNFSQHGSRYTSPPVAAGSPYNNLFGPVMYNSNVSSVQSPVYQSPPYQYSPMSQNQKKRCF